MEDAERIIELERRLAEADTLISTLTDKREVERRQAADALSKAGDKQYEEYKGRMQEQEQRLRLEHLSHLQAQNILELKAEVYDLVKEAAAEHVITNQHAFDSLKMAKESLTAFLNREEGLKPGAVNQLRNMIGDLDAALKVGRE